MFDQLQNQLQEIYEIETSHKVSNFITSNQTLKQCMIHSGVENHESVFVLEEDGYVNISVFLDQIIVDSLNDTTTEIDINHACQALEGISHFLYFIYNAEYNRQVTLMELELQAEVDKFIILLQNRLSNDIHDNVSGLHRSLFSDIQFRDSLNTIERQRYEDANFYAGKFCRDLIKRHNLKPQCQSMNLELRRFYRLPLQQKLQHINQLH